MQNGRIKDVYISMFFVGPLMRWEDVTGMLVGHFGSQDILILNYITSKFLIYVRAFEKFLWFYHV